MKHNEPTLNINTQYMHSVQKIL